MTPLLSLIRTRRRSAGVGIVTAIFLLVVLAGLGVALVTIFGAQRQNALLDEQGARAYQAARAGIEWGLFQRLNPAGGGCASDSETGFMLPANSMLAGFAVRVSCRRVEGPASTVSEVNLERWRIRAVACAPPDAGNTCPDRSANPDYVRRIVEVQI